MPTVFIDPNDVCDSHLGVVVEHATGVVYEHQCGGTACETRVVEGYYVPVGAIVDGESLTAERFRGPFHVARGCVWGAIQIERIPELQRMVEAIGYECPEVGALRLDPARIEEIVEAWVPVLLPDGTRGILVWQNCD